jgi:hypothetical protein
MENIAREEAERQLTAKAPTPALAALVSHLDTPQTVIPTCGISKSKFVAGLQCPKRLFLQVHQPHLAKLTDQGNKDQGTAVGVLARNLFRGGVLVDADKNHLADAIRLTQELVNNPEVPAIFEGAFRHDGVLVRVDVLLRSPKKDEFHLIEVKGSTTVKPDHLHDLSIQQYVLRGAGIQVKSSQLMHVNPDYVLDGDLDLLKLFLIEEIPSNRLLARSTVSGILNEQYTMLVQPEPPNIETGSFCKSPYRCEFFDHCHPPPDVDDVRSLPISADKIRMLLHNGVTTVSELPTNIDLRLYWHFTEKQCSRINSARSARKCGLAVGAKLQSELAAIKYPVCFIDFESVSPAVPKFRGMKPYEPIPIQWSVHRQAHQEGVLQHNAFLSPNATEDPRRPFVESLSKAVSGASSIVVYGSYENTQLSNLCRWFPEYDPQICSMQKKLVDLLRIVRENVYSPLFFGSYSIKRVLPVLVPTMSYQDLEVQSGIQVASIWEQLSDISMDNAEQARLQARLRKTLLDYCARDTLALAYLVGVLRRHGDSH